MKIFPILISALLLNNAHAQAIYPSIDYSSIEHLFKFQAVRGKYEQEMEHQLYCAKLYREKANQYFYEAENKSILLPEIEAKQKIRTLITSSVGTFTIQDPKTKVLIIGISLLGEVVS